MKVLSYRALIFRRKKILEKVTNDLIEAERCIVGYTTRQHLILDLDKSHSMFATLRLVKMIQSSYPDLGDCLISESSHDGYHCIFDSKLTWERIMHISRTLTGLMILNRNFTKVRTFREDLTLRITGIDRGEEKSEAPIPKMLILCNHYCSLPHYNPTMSVADLMLDLAEREFSGVYAYLSALSAFRPFHALLLQVA